MIFQRNSGPKIELYIENSEFERVENFNFLGLTLNQKLDWIPHLTITAQKAACGLGILKRLKSYLPSSTLKTLYYSLVHSHFQYQLLNWGYNCKNLEKLQKRAIRIMSNDRYLAHSGPILKRYNALRLRELHNLSQIKFYYRHVHYA